MFSPDGEHLAYCVLDEKGRARVVLDEREGPLYDGLPNLLLFSGDATIEYIAERIEGDVRKVIRVTQR
jgi:hypothetical protein